MEINVEAEVSIMVRYMYTQENGSKKLFSHLKDLPKLCISLLYRLIIACFVLEIF